MSDIILIDFLTSSIVLNLPNENRIDWLACSDGKFMADKTWDADIDPELQAAPEEQAIPSRSRFKSKLSTETLGKNTFDIL